MKQKVYLSGQITNLPPDKYHENFEKAGEWMVMCDYEVVNPLHVVACEAEDCNEDARKPDGSYLHHWSCYMRYDIIQMLQCDAIAMLPNWENSKGAHLEKLIAIECGLEVMHITDDYRSHY